MKASAETVDWLAAYYAAMDALRFDEVAAFMHEDIATRYPTGFETQGRESLLRSSAAALGSLAGIEHSILNVWEEGDEIVFELDVTYRRRDGGVIRRGGIGIFTMREGRIAAQRLFVDMAGVWD